MKNTNKYIKTRRQIDAAKANKLTRLVQLVQTNAHKKQTDSTAKDQQHQNIVANNKAQKPYKTKKIHKNKQTNTLMNHKKPSQTIFKSQKKQKHKIPPKIIHIKNDKKSPKKKVKIQQAKTKESNNLINIEAKSEKKIKTLADYNFTMNPFNQKMKTENNNKNLVDGVLPKYKSDIKKVQPTESKTKIEIKEENAQNQSVIKQNYSIPKKMNKTQKFKIQSKLIQNFEQSQANHVQQTNIVPPEQPLQQIKKKGRPKKVVVQQIYELRPPQEHVKLEEFIQNAIKLRKLKNQKQFFECFSRINQYAQESWEYGDLSKQLKWAPQRQEVLKIGIPIARGIRKQIQQQQLVNITA